MSGEMQWREEHNEEGMRLEFHSGDYIIQFQGVNKGWTWGVYYQNKLFDQCLELDVAKRVCQSHHRDQSRARTAFEQWVEGLFNPTRTGDRYDDQRVALAWDAWRAALNWKEANA